LPLASWHEYPLQRFLIDSSLAGPEAYFIFRRSFSPAFFFTPEQRHIFRPLLAVWNMQKHHPINDAEALRRGNLRYFAHTLVPIGFPPAWHTNPLTGEHVDAEGHWSQLSDFGYGDIKAIWEPSRFGFVYALVRAYWCTGVEQYAAWFWQLIEDWRQHNPPQQGLNWKCGQEISLRIMAWCFGLYGFLTSESTTASRVAMLAQMIAVAGQRIEANLYYALSQQNNHGISEGVGLWTIGTLFPEFRAAAQWQTLGREVLEGQGQALIYEDGSFAQHSMNYHRLMLHDYLWCIRLGDVHEQPFSAALKERVSKAGMLLYQLQDEISGQVPCYGQNDGALILPLNNCDYHNFRPVIQATHYLATGTRCYDSGPWDEDLLWLFGPSALTAPRQALQRTDLQAKHGGYYTLRSPHGFVFTRGTTLRHRPGQADMLHIDLWWQGHNIALDAGTYSYNAPAPWNNAFSQTVYHNTVTVDNMDQMEHVSPFLWLPWLHSQVHTFHPSPSGWFAYWQGEHDGYQRCRPPVRHRRGIMRLGEQHWLVLDALSSRGPHQYRLHWLFPDSAYTWDANRGHLTLMFSEGPYHVQSATLRMEDVVFSLVRADPHSPRGWRSVYYSAREPALSLAVATSGAEVSFWTVLGPAPCQVEPTVTGLEITTKHWQTRVIVQPEVGEIVIAEAHVRGACTDSIGTYSCRSY
jgi:asparagine synthase (glutamine-hydrolysing)